MPPTPTYFNGLGAWQILLVPVIKWVLVGITALSIWLIIRSYKSEGLSDLKLSKDVEDVLSQKLSQEEHKKVVAEFEQQRKQAFDEGKKSSPGVIGQMGNLVKWCVIGVGVAIVAKKVFFKSKNDTIK